MLTLYHHPFCPHSRFIRLAIGEYGLDLRLVEERVWERREAFLVLNLKPQIRKGRSRIFWARLMAAEIYAEIKPAISP